MASIDVNLGEKIIIKCNLVIGMFREYFSMVSIETKTIVETIENAQGIDF